MRDRMKGKVAIVSGGASGGGAAFRGGRRCGGHHRPQRAAWAGLAFELARQGHRVIFAGADVSKKPEVEAAVEIVRQQLGQVNVLFNHAGTIVIKPFQETEEEAKDFQFVVKVKSMYLMTRAGLPMMIAQGKGSIVCTSSISAVYATPMEVLYDATEGACHMFARAVAVEFRDRGIRRNAVCPGFIETPHGVRAIRELPALGVDASEAAITAAQGRLGQPEDIARVALYLASDDSEFVTGAQLFVDGGFSAA